MKKKCPQCKLVNFATAEYCLRCKMQFREVGGRAASTPLGTFVKRAVVCVIVIVVVLVGFYLSLIGTARPLEYEQTKTIERAVRILEERGFHDDVFLLRYVTVFRAEDNWLNASTRAENAYAATNFPFEIITIYPEFFSASRDDAERAAILLHEARHLRGEDEPDAYRYVWKNRARLGWTRDAYGISPTWHHVRSQTRAYVPELFVCPANEYDDCTETK